MGYRDNDIIDDERADAALRRALERIHALDQVAPPPDLVTQTGRRLPAMPPAAAARQLARRRLLRVGGRVALFALCALIVLLGVAGLAGGRVALLFGDGASGVSRTLLMVQLLAKPLWHSLGSGGAVAVVVGLAGAVWLWWWTLQRTPIYQVENAP